MFGGVTQVAVGSGTDDEGEDEEERPDTQQEEGPGQVLLSGTAAGWVEETGFTGIVFPGHDSVTLAAGVEVLTRAPVVEVVLVDHEVIRNRVSLPSGRVLGLAPLSEEESGEAEGDDGQKEGQNCEEEIDGSLSEQVDDQVEDGQDNSDDGESLHDGGGPRPEVVRYTGVGEPVSGLFGPVDHCPSEDDDKETGDRQSSPSHLVLFSGHGESGVGDPGEAEGDDEAENDEDNHHPVIHPPGPAETPVLKVIVVPGVGVSLEALQSAEMDRAVKNQVEAADQEEAGEDEGHDVGQIGHHLVGRSVLGGQGTAGHDGPGESDDGGDETDDQDEGVEDGEPGPVRPGDGEGQDDGQEDQQSCQSAKTHGNLDVAIKVALVHIAAALCRAGHLVQRHVRIRNIRNVALRKLSVSLLLLVIHFELYKSKEESILTKSLDHF